MKKTDILIYLLTILSLLSSIGCVETTKSKDVTNLEDENIKFVKEAITRIYDQVALVSEAKGDYNLFFLSGDSLIKNKPIEKNKFNKYISDLEKYFDADELTNWINNGSIPSDEYLKAGFNDASVKFVDVTEKDNTYIVSYDVEYKGVSSRTIEYKISIELENGKIKTLSAPMGIGLPKDNSLR